MLASLAFALGTVVSLRSVLTPVSIGIVYAQLGEADRAFQILNAALDDDSWCMFLLLRNLLFYMKAGFWFDPIRDDPRFGDLLQRMNLD